MSLPSELISQFVKITNDKPKEKKETTVYGEVVENNGKNYVRLDGSDLLTPMSTTVDANPGERVAVLIKNHTATVTGNISSPSARTDDVKDIVLNKDEMYSKIEGFEIALGNKLDVSDYGANKVLWTGTNYMNAAQTITLSEAVSAQANGIVLIWSYYSNGAASDFNFHSHFVPKWLVINYAGKGSDYHLADHTGNILAHKYLYISDTKITGNDDNDDDTIVGSQATYTNNAFVLRAVIGV